MSGVFVLAAGSGGGGGSGAFVYVVIALVVIGFVLSLFRLRRGGPGPAVNYVPKAFRGRLNSAYRRARWQEPYDADGNRNPERTAT